MNVEMRKRTLITMLSMSVTTFFIWIGGHDFFTRGIVSAFALICIAFIGIWVWAFPWDDNE